jgi:hypothetical protein
MTTFETETRHYWQNSRCRSKLPTPVANAREAVNVGGAKSHLRAKLLRRVRSTERGL